MAAGRGGHREDESALSQAVPPLFFSCFYYKMKKIDSETFYNSYMTALEVTYKNKETAAMTKKEISEIKRQFTPSNCSITRICGCYVDGEKNKKALFKEAFLSLPEEDMFKYFEILRKNLSGTLGKNLMNLEFPLEAERRRPPRISSEAEKQPASGRGSSGSFL